MEANGRGQKYTHKRFFQGIFRNNMEKGKI
jgi:hypothetical protein